ncbi:hypothetical protein VPNG_05509 [Cytospora leucostoma]|uniref:DUF7962 domain-containing protein n=1 Tax=Cytospora leucostoma TaxID=1230097 RepID=A0A423XBM1_9PEZI|nr:hypothetical protein VPNG_05509 [Cytospora leucostoma]
MPRPDIAKLGIKYRRIPILSIGRDVYLDTRLILQKLEQLPDVSAPRLGAAEGTEQRGVERLLEALNIDGGVFLWAAALLPRDLPVFKDPAFLRDRADYLAGGSGGGAGAVLQQTPAARYEALSGIRDAFELLETTLLADGRDWILKTDGPSLADIEAIWPFHWLSGLPGALPPDQVSEARFPKVFAWIERFDRAVSAGGDDEVPSVSGDEAAQTIVGSSYFEAQDGRVDETEPLGKALGLKRGERVVVFPLDTGSNHKDSGVLLGFDGKEVVFETVAEVQGSPSVRVHAPRHGFRVVREDQASRL